ncbi:MAG: GntR family transcriptional regulator [Paracoccaceae bacterium]|nr:GntR family transcriptional regulator [Paracoccaceae bacterium]
MSKHKKSFCEADLRARILTQAIPPGADLDEASLAEEYGISRTPLREVLHRLAGGGFVRLEENRGAKVESMDFGTLRVFFQTAPLIYCSIARQAAENRSARQILKLKDIQLEFSKAAKNGDAAIAGLLNHDFHEQIGNMAQNPYLFAGLKRMLVDHTRLSQTFFAPQSPADETRVNKAIEQHDAMISAIERRELTLATDLTLQHWDLSRDQLEKYVRPDPLPLDVISLKDRRHAL